MTIERVFVAGAGLMGHGIAQVHAAHRSRRRSLYEPDLTAREAGRDRIAANLDRAVAKGRLEPKRIETRRWPDRVNGDTRCRRRRRPRRRGRVRGRRRSRRRSGASSIGWRRADAIFASNTSSISIGRLAEAVSPARRERFVGMHFFSPVPVMPLIELIRGADTTDATEAAIRDACRTRSASR